MFVLFFLLPGCKTEGNRKTLDPTTARIVENISSVIEYELQDKQIPAISIALVEGQKILWSGGFGFQDPENEIKATSNTVYKIGSVSKLFTDIAVMQLVEKGELNLDVPITEYLPDFKPENPFGTEITLRQLMSHRSGLVREPPVGNYFDDSGTSLKETIESLYSTKIVYPPESKTKYSNAAIATVGYVLEQTQGKPFAKYLKEAVLDPIGLEVSAFEPTAATSANLAKAKMWTYDNRLFDAPTFELGMAPAGSMYSTVDELSEFVKTLLADGVTPTGNQLLSPESLEQMLTPQYAEEGAETGYGIGFRISDFNGNKMIGHGGAIYGFSTQLAVLPEKKLGVVAVSSLDVTNSVVSKIVNYALQQLLNRNETEQSEEYEKSEQIPVGRFQSLVGQYSAGDIPMEIVRHNNELHAWVNGAKLRLRSLDPNTLIFDGRSTYGPTISLKGDGLLEIAGKEFVRKEKVIPPQTEFAEYIGEYGWDHNVLYIHERFGQLQALIEWTELDPLTPGGRDSFSFPNYGMYHGEGIVFRRDDNGKISGAKVAGIQFPRRLTEISDGETFTINALKPVDELRKIALSSNPPEEDEKRPMDLVELSDLHPNFKYDIRYASTNNFMQAPFYKSAHAYMQRPAAEALVVALNKLEKLGYGLVIHDAYRPWFVTKMFWDATPKEMSDFVATPSKGSRHNRGCAVDLTLYDLKTGDVIEMVGGYDEFSPRSFPAYPGGTSKQRYYRELLREVMESSDFTIYEWEWWHFDYKDWNEYPIGNLTFEELE